MLGPGRVFSALFRFYAATGTRLGLRTALGLSVAFVVAIGLSHDPGAFVVSLARAVFESASPVGLVGILGAAAIHSGLAFRAVSDAGRGWALHLPVTRRARFAAVLAGGALAQLPVAVAVGVLLLGSGLGGLEIRPIRVALLPVVFAIALAWTAPVRRRALTGACALASTLAVLSESALGAVGAGLVLLSGYLVCGGLAGAAEPGRRSPWPWSSARGYWTVVWLRSIGSQLVGAYVVAGAVLGATYLFVRNNELPSHLETMGARAGAGVAIVAFVVTVGEALGSRRPAWAFGRSLPWSSRRRVGFDAELLALAALPVLWLAGSIDSAVVLPVAAVGAYSGLRALASVRPDGQASERLAVAMAAECLVVALLVAVQPLAGGLLLPGGIWAWHRLVDSERRQRVGLWRELGYSAAGDSAL